MADAAVFNPVKRFTDRHEHNFRVATHHLLVNRYGAAQALTSLDYDAIVVVFEVKLREGNLRHIQPARVSALFDSMFHKMCPHARPSGSSCPIFLWSLLHSGTLCFPDATASLAVPSKSKRLGNRRLPDSSRLSGRFKACISERL